MANSNDVALRISEVGDQAPGFERLLRETWGFDPVQDGSDWVILARDAGLRVHSRGVVHIHGPLGLSKANRHKLAGKLISWLPEEVNEYFARHAQRLNFEFDEDSALNRIYACRARLSASPKEDVRAIVRDELLPFMIEMHASHVCGVTVDAHYQQGIYTFAKFGLLLKNHAFPVVEELVFQRRALRGILPHALNLLSYVNALTRLAPLAVTLAVGRGACTWHFVAPDIFMFGPSVRCEGLFEQFVESMSPIAEQNVILPSPSMSLLSGGESCVFLRVIVEAINNMATFLNDLRNFVEIPHLAVDFARQIQAFGAFDLLFADIISLNYSTSGFQRISCAMNALDKLANLLKHVGGATGRESSLFKQLLSMQRCEVCRQIYQHRVLPVSSDINDALIKLIEDAYRGMQDHYRKEVRRDMHEDQIVERLYQQRNLRHGTFLEGEQFRQLFEESKGTVPSEIVMVVFLLTLALALDPWRFLGLDS